MTESLPDLLDSLYAISHPILAREKESLMTPDK
jgi:hypothetical protein